MVYKFISNLKGRQRGITLIEIVVVLFIISTFSLILIADFPKIQRQFALSEAAYNLAQDLRSAEDLGLSGAQIKDGGVPAKDIPVTGYGVYVNPSMSATQYLIYADVKPGTFLSSDLPTPGNTVYDGDFFNTPCSEVNQVRDGAFKKDCVIQIIDIKKENSGLTIDSVDNSAGFVSINFRPPDPIVNISGLNPGKSAVSIVLKNSDGLSRTVSINTAGLISVK